MASKRGRGDDPGPEIAVGDAAVDGETKIDELSQLEKAGGGLADQCQTAQGGRRLAIPPQATTFRK